VLGEEAHQIPVLSVPGRRCHSVAATVTETLDDAIHDLASVSNAGAGPRTHRQHGIEDQTGPGCTLGVGIEDDGTIVAVSGINGAEELGDRALPDADLTGEDADAERASQRPANGLSELPLLEIWRPDLDVVANQLGPALRAPGNMRSGANEVDEGRSGRLLHPALGGHLGVLGEGTRSLHMCSECGQRDHPVPQLEALLGRHRTLFPPRDGT